MSRKFRIILQCEVEVEDSLHQWALQQSYPRKSLLAEITSNIKDLKQEAGTNDVTFTKVIAWWPEDYLPEC